MPVAVVAQVAHSRGNAGGIRAEASRRMPRWTLKLGSCLALAWLKPHDKTTKNTSPREDRPGPPQPLPSESIMPGASTIPRSSPTMSFPSCSESPFKAGSRPGHWHLPEGDSSLMSIVGPLLYYPGYEGTFPGRPCVCRSGGGAGGDRVVALPYAGKSGPEGAER